jgi:tRNA1Val (adenine37-N6)-methyltransferase
VSALECTEDRLLGGRVLLRQPLRGLRAGLDAVLLAAGIPAAPGQRVLEAGCGSGAAFLCLAARVPGLTIIAVERDPELAALAAENAAANGLAGRVEVIAGDVRDLALAGCLPRCDHAFANPPFWPDGTPPPDALRHAATHAAGRPDHGAGPACLGHWAGFLAAALTVRGTLTLILPAARLDAGLVALAAAGCGAARLVPFWPHAGEAAKRLLVQGRHGIHGPAQLAAGLVLHESGGGFSAAANRILRDAAALPG